MAVDETLIDRQAQQLAEATAQVAIAIRDLPDWAKVAVLNGVMEAVQSPTDEPPASGEEG